MCLSVRCMYQTRCVLVECCFKRLLQCTGGLSELRVYPFQGATLNVSSGPGVKSADMKAVWALVTALAVSVGSSHSMAVTYQCFCARVSGGCKTLCQHSVSPTLKHEVRKPCIPNLLIVNWSKKIPQKTGYLLKENVIYSIIEPKLYKKIKNILHLRE